MHHAHVGVECPLCHWKHFLEIDADDSLLKSPAAREIQAHLQAWVASRCPDHLGAIAQMSKN
jgi:hypothetical protein